MRLFHTGLLLLVLLPVTAIAQTASAEKIASDATQKEKVRRLLELTGGGELGVQILDQVLASFRKISPSVPDEVWTAVRSKVRPSDLVEMVAPIYEKHLTEEDLDALVAFFSSPAGRRFVQKQPLLIAESMKVGREWGERIAREVVAELEKKGYSTP